MIRYSSGMNYSYEMPVVRGRPRLSEPKLQAERCQGVNSDAKLSGRGRRMKRIGKVRGQLDKPQIEALE
jgi:hypothetical protein